MLLTDIRNVEVLLDTSIVVDFVSTADVVGASRRGDVAEIRRLVALLVTGLAVGGSLVFDFQDDPESGLSRPGLVAKVLRDQTSHGADNVQDRMFFILNNQRFEYPLLEFVRLANIHRVICARMVKLPDGSRWPNILSHCREYEHQGVLSSAQVEYIQATYTRHRFV